MPDRWYYRLIKGTETALYLALIWLTWRFFDDELHWTLPIGAALLSGGWLALTFARTKQLLRTYFDLFSRLEILIPSVLGAALSIFALVATEFAGVRIAAVVEIVAWSLLTLRYRRNRRRYVQQGHGPLPAGCWISPPPEVLQPGDMLLTSGRVAAGLRESVGHGETVIRSGGGPLLSLSSTMDKGAVLHPVGEYASIVSAHGHYVVLRLREELPAEQMRRAEGIAREMLEENRRWRDRVEMRRRRFVGRLPLPRARKQALLAALRPTGYDWTGLLMGRIASERWTCVGACLELYHRLGVRTNAYGTGLLGFGTTLFDPIMPVRFLSDPAFRLLSETDRPGSQTPRS